MDRLSVNGLKCLTTVAHDIFYRTAQYVTSPIASVYAKCVDEKFHKAMDLYAVNQEPPIHMNYTSAQEHVLRAERNH
eukprot:9748828-Ditylum_brightwellii.AAC.1